MVCKGILPPAGRNCQRLSCHTLLCQERHQGIDTPDVDISHTPELQHAVHLIVFYPHTAAQHGFHLPVHEQWLENDQCCPA